MSPASPDGDENAAILPALDAQLDSIRPFLRAHFGGVVVDNVDRDGNVQVRFTGACEGCILQPITFVSRVTPALEKIAGVRSVNIGGVSADGRLSPQAISRIRKYFLEEP
jgi:Fe-S cluster biogenesis protein NfuA